MSWAGGSADLASGDSVGGRPRWGLDRQRQSDRRQEAIAAPVHRGYKPWRLCHVPQRLANFANVNRQRGIAHRGAGPDRLKEFSFRDQLPGSLDQGAQHGKGLGGQVDGLRAAPHALFRRSSR